MLGSGGYRRGPDIEVKATNGRTGIFNVAYSIERLVVVYCLCAILVLVQRPLLGLIIAREITCLQCYRLIDDRGFSHEIGEDTRC
jgi:hypothetical protein